MAEDKMKYAANMPSLDASIILALETAPRPSIPPDFAARIAGQLAPRATVTLTPGRYGRRAAVACLIVLLALILFFAHGVTGSPLYSFSIESIFCAQFALLAVWLMARNAGYTSLGSF
jgi:hypothetical protein